MAEPTDYETVSAALAGVLAAIEGIDLALDYEPTTVQQTPMIYSLLDSFQEEDGGGSVVDVTYVTLHRLVVSYQEPEPAEAELRALVDGIPAALRTSADLAGLAPGGVACRRGELGWVVLGGQVFRSADFYSETTVRRSRRAS